VDPEGDRSALGLAGTPSRSTHPVSRAVQGGPGGGGDLGRGRRKFLAADRDHGTGGRDVPPGDTWSAERSDQVSEGDPNAGHTDVEVERGGDLGSGAGGGRIRSGNE